MRPVSFTQVTQMNQENQEHNQPNRLIRISRVVELTNLSKSYIYQLCRDGLFPTNVQLVPGGTSVAWVEKEILDWIDSRIKARDEVA